MTTLREAAQQAVAMLKTGMPEYDAHDVLEVLEAALEQPEQEPVAWISPASESMIGKTDENGSAYHIITTSKKTANNSVPLFTYPPRREWRGLTEEEIISLANEPRWPVGNSYVVPFARAIEAALKELNHE
jgi:hypothetical protein